MKTSILCFFLLISLAFCGYNWNGNFASRYPTKTCMDLIKLHRVGNNVTAIKITGTEYVPAGKMTFSVYLQNEVYGLGYACMAEKGYRHPYLVPVIFEAQTEDRFELRDDPNRPTRPSGKSRWGNNMFYRHYPVCAHDSKSDAKMGA